MQNSAKTLALLATSLLATGLLAAPALAQPGGHLRYEVTRRIDPSEIRVVVNGQLVKPGSPDYPADIPETTTTALTLAYAGQYARETREGGATRTTTGGFTAAPQTTVVERPFEEATYLDLAGRTVSTVLTMQADQASTAYRSDEPYVASAHWTLLPQTKKVAGYLCHKATAPFKQETYTIWYTTDLPFTYSPVRGLMPEKGVVLQLDSEKEQYQATKTDQQPVTEAEVRPTQTAQKVTPAELKDHREKAMADFRQRLIAEEAH